MGVPALAGFEARARYAAVVFAGAALLDDRAIQSAQQGAPGLSFVSSLSLMWYTVPGRGRACTIAVRLLNISETSLSLPSLAAEGDSRIGRLQHLNGRAGVVVGRLQALQQVFGFPESANEKDGLWFARQSQKKRQKNILFADGTHSNSLPLARDIGDLLPNQADDTVDDRVKDLFDFASVGPPNQRGPSPTQVRNRSRGLGTGTRHERRNGVEAVFNAIELIIGHASHSDFKVVAAGPPDAVLELDFLFPGAHHLVSIRRVSPRCSRATAASRAYPHMHIYTSSVAAHCLAFAHKR